MAGGGGSGILKGGISHVSHYSASYPTVLNSPISSGGSYNWRQQLRDRQIARRRGISRSSSSGLDLSIGGGGWSSRSRSSSSIMRSNGGGGGGVLSSGGSYETESLSLDSTPQMMMTTTTIAPECQGNMTLWTRTYLRGESFPVSTDIEDLDLHGFNNKLVSLEVSAGCCWTIFSEPHFQGDSKLFREGQHKSVSSVGKLFRAASSVKKTSCY